MPDPTKARSHTRCSSGYRNDTGRTRCGASSVSSRSRSVSASRTRCKSSIWRYRRPPWTSLLDRLEVPPAQSWASTMPTLRPRVTASRATPAPVTPPPMTRMSSSWSVVVLASSVSRAAARVWAVSAVVFTVVLLAPWPLRGPRVTSRPQPWRRGVDKATCLYCMCDKQMRKLYARTCTGVVVIDEPNVLGAATMYYLQDMKMEVIARHLHTSRSTVSRLLKRARDTGLVEIRLRAESSRAPGLGQSINATFGVATFVVPVPDTANDIDRLEQVARTSAKLLASWFDSGMVMGIAWGTTLAAVSRHLTHRPTRGSAVVQLNGAANDRTSGVDYTSSLISSFGSAFDAAVHYFPVPAFFDFPETKAAMWRERSVRRVLEVQGRADIALFSVGAVAGAIPSHVYAAGYLDDDDVRTLHTEGVVGDVCTVFLRADGSYRDVVLNARATGPTPVS